MNTMSRKQREIQQRTEQIREVARELLVSGGYHGLSMEAIAERLEYSKGTVYNHFKCKEEIIISLAIETMDRRTDMFRRAAMFRGVSRERLAAIGVASELFMQLFPTHFAVDQILRSASVWHKTSESSRISLQGCESRCIEIVAGIIRDGLARDELRLKDAMTAEDVVFGLWSMTQGANLVVNSSPALLEYGISEPYWVIRQNINLMLDGLAWKPLSSEHDYEVVRERIQQDLFADELQRLG